MKKEKMLFLLGIWKIGCQGPLSYKQMIANTLQKRNYLICILRQWPALFKNISFSIYFMKVNLH